MAPPERATAAAPAACVGVIVTEEAAIPLTVLVAGGLVRMEGPSFGLADGTAVRFFLALTLLSLVPSLPKISKLNCFTMGSCRQLIASIVSRCLWNRIHEAAATTEVIAGIGPELCVIGTWRFLRFSDLATLASDRVCVKRDS